MRSYDELPPLAIEHLELALKKLKRKEGLRFHLIAHSDLGDLPWILIVEEAKLPPRVSKALPEARRNGYKVAKQAEGTLRVVRNKPIFTVESTGIKRLAKLICRVWPKRLLALSREKPNNKLKLLGAALRGARIENDVDEASEADALDDSETREELDEWGEINVEALFAEDAVAVKKAVRDHSTILSSLQTNVRAGDSTRAARDIEELVNQLLDTAPLIADMIGERNVVAVVAQIMSSLPHAGKMSEEEALAASTQIATMVSCFSDVARSFELWRNYVEQMLEYKNALTKDSPSAEEEETLLALHGKAATRADAAKSEFERKNAALNDATETLLGAGGE